MKYLILLLVIPLVSALDCNQLKNQEYCQEIQNSNLSIEDKEYLMQDITSNKKYIIKF